MRKITVLIIVLLLSNLCLAQSRSPSHENVQSGEITMEQDSKPADSYETQQEKAIGFIKKVQSIAIAGGGTIAAPDESVLSYLNVAYLYCSITQGTCPQILDNVLEADVMNSKAAGSVSCPIMTNFWKLYIKSDMEQRHSHYVRTGYLSTTEDFKKRVRPAYIKCKETISQILAAPDFSQRYKAGSQIQTSIQKSVRITEELKEKVPNLFTALGAR